MKRKIKPFSLFLALLLTAGLTVDLEKGTIGFGTVAYAFDDANDWLGDGDDDYDIYDDDDEADDDSDDNGDWWNNDPDHAFELGDAVCEEERDDPDWTSDWGYEFPDEPENDDYENVEEEDSSGEQEDSETTEECKGEKCDICGGYITSGISFRNSEERTQSCPVCTCKGSIMPDCERIGDAVNMTINNYPLTLYSMRQYVDGDGCCVLLYDNPSLVADGQIRYYSGEMFEDLTAAMNDWASKEGSLVPCAAVLVAKKGQSLFTDKQLVDFMLYSNANVAFTTIYLVTSDNAYALRNDNVEFVNAIDYYDHLDNDGNFKSDLKEGLFIEEAKGLLGDDYDPLIGKAYMYNQMGVGISILQCTSDLAGNMLNFQKVDACKIVDIGHHRIQRILCGEYVK